MIKSKHTAEKRILGNLSPSSRSGHIRARDGSLIPRIGIICEILPSSYDARLEHEADAVIMLHVFGTDRGLLATLEFGDFHRLFAARIRSFLPSMRIPLLFTVIIFTNTAVPILINPDVDLIAAIVSLFALNMLLIKIP